MSWYDRSYYNCILQVFVDRDNICNFSWNMVGICFGLLSWLKWREVVGANPLYTSEGYTNTSGGYTNTGGGYTNTSEGYTNL